MRKRLLPVAAVFVLGVGALAAESLVVVGAGKSGTWDTQLSFANPTDNPISLQITGSSEVFPSCIDPCPIAYLTIPPMGTNGLWSSQIPGLATSNGPLYTIFATLLNGTALPTMRARVVNRYANPDEAVELAVLNLQTALAMNPGVLVFPSATRSAAVHSNLAIGSFLSDGEKPATITVQAFSHDGTLLGSGTFSNCGPRCTNIFLIDVLHQLGVESLDDGQIRVTKVSGDGVLWGELAVLDTVGHVQISLGRNP